jgi:hypothetical protein
MYRAGIFGRMARAMLLAACGMSAVQAWASDGAAFAGIEWRCVQEHDAYFHVQCVPRADSLDDFRAATPILDAEQEPAMARDAAFRERDTRPVAMREADEVFSTAAWRVPLYARPSDVREVTRLLAAVLCGEAPRCSVTWASGVTLASGAY